MQADEERLETETEADAKAEAEVEAENEDVDVLIEGAFGVEELAYGTIDVDKVALKDCPRLDVLDGLIEGAIKAQGLASFTEQNIIVGLPADWPQDLGRLLNDYTIKRV